MATYKTLPDVEYSTYPGLDMPMFRCPALSAKLSVRACADRYNRAQGTSKEAQACLICRDCKVGAGHAGKSLVHRSWLFGKAICPRCGQPTTRMIHDRLCVSCANRQYEWIKGTNAKGAPVSQDRPLSPQVLTYEVGGVTRVYRSRYAFSIVELMAQVMRKVSGRVIFKPTPDQSGLKQGRLF